MEEYSCMFDGKFGIERETLRIGTHGELAQTKHPFTDPALERDFCENQLEIITPPCPSVHEAVEALARLDASARAVLHEQEEQLWMFSNPPHVENEDEIPVAVFGPELAAKNRYRRYLEQKYGKRLMLYSGIHFNFSFSEEYLTARRDRECPGAQMRDFRDRFYLRLSKQALIHSWLLVLLTAASPVEDLTFGQNTGKRSVYASARNSEVGYWNRFLPALDYSGLREYVDSVQGYIRSGDLYSAAELYLPVRLKPVGANEITGLTERGVSHIELRMFDLNPLEPQGISEKDLEFAHLLLLYLSEREDLDFTPAMQEAAVRRHQEAAHAEVSPALIGEARGILQDMTEAFAGHPDAREIIDYQMHKLTGERLCGQIAALPAEVLIHLAQGGCRCGSCR